MSSEEKTVVLFQYDISNGMASKIYKFMTGKDIEAIWHTSLVVFDKEYYYQGGICCDFPRFTPYGTPVKETVFGKTTKTQEEFETYLMSISQNYTQSNYDIINHNCNHFTDEICRFLCNKPLPEQILNQEKLVGDTAFGKWAIQFLKNMNENMVKKLNCQKV